MIDTPILGKKDLDYLLDKNYNIPITIIATFLALRNRFFTMIREHLFTQMFKVKSIISRYQMFNWM